MNQPPDPNYLNHIHGVIDILIGLGVRVLVVDDIHGLEYYVFDRIDYPNRGNLDNHERLAIIGYRVSELFQVSGLLGNKEVIATRLSQIVESSTSQKFVFSPQLRWKIITPRA